MGKAPQPTPPKETSAASTATNVATAIANAYMGNVNEYGPDGSRVVKKTGNQRIFDPYTKKHYRVPTFDVRTQLSPQQRRIKRENDQASLRLARLASDQAGFLKGYMREPFEYEVGDHEVWAGGIYDRLNQDANGRAREGLEARLVNQGIDIGSEAYKDAMSDLYGGQQTARDQFMLDSYQTGFQSAQAQRNQPINEITALLSGGQVSMPTFGTQVDMPTIPTTNNADIIGRYDQARIDAYNANMNALLGGLKFVGGLFTSDERVKTDKKKVGETDKGIGLYTFKFKGTDEPQFGLMAQDVEKKKPKAVVTGPDGIKRVNYKEALR